MVAGEATAGKHDGIGADFLERTARPGDAQTRDAAVVVCVQIGHVRFRHQLCAGTFGRIAEQRQQFFAIASGRDVQARPGVTQPGPLEVEQQRHAMRRRQPVDGRPGFLGHGARQQRIGAAAGLGHDVVVKALRRIVDAVARMLRRGRRAHRAQRHRRAAPGPLVAFEDEDVDASVACRECGGEATGAGADDGDRYGVIELALGIDNDAHAANSSSRQACGRRSAPAIVRAVVS